MADGSGAAEASGLFGRRDPVFRPWPLPGKEPADIADFVQRLKTQGIEFRSLSEEGLRKQIEEQRRKKDEGDDGDDNAMDDVSTSRNGHDTAKELDDRPKDVEAMMAKRDDVLRTLESALQNGLIVVDFVSLLLSKDRPTQAMQTLSPLLREKVGIGTLSAGRIANAAQAARALQMKNNGGGGGISAAERLALDETTRFNAQRLLDHKTECVGWQLLAMDRAAEMLAAGRKRLHAELRREETYWSEVLAVRDRGWGLSRLPGDRRVLRVKFGFSEAAPDLRAVGFAPLRRVKRGHVALDMSALGPPSTVVVTLRRRLSAATEIGRSSPPARLPANAPLEDRILEARNTIYAKELWRELNREARQMAAHGVKFRDAEIVFPAGAHTEGVITLAPLQLASTAPSSVSSDPEAESTSSDLLNELAETISSSLNLFLAHGHRQHYRQRSVPVAPADSSGTPPPTYYMLRPIVANLKYEKAITHISTFLSDLCSILHGVGQSGAQFTLFERPLSSYLPPAAAADSASSNSTAARSGQQQSSSEGLCTGFLASREFTFELTITPQTRLSIRSRTTVVPLKTQYLIQLLPPSPQTVAPASQGAKNPLLDAFPPADNYATLRDVVDYVSSATSHVLAAYARGVAGVWEAESGSGVTWSSSVDGMEVHHQNNAFWKMRFVVVPNGTTTELDALVALEHDVGSTGRTDIHADINDNEDDYVQIETGFDDDGDDDKSADLDADSPLQRLNPPELRLYASWPSSETESAIHRRWIWSAESMLRSVGSPAESLRDIVQGCVSGRLRPASKTEPQ